MGKLCIKCNTLLNSENQTWYRSKNYIHKCNSCIKSEKRKWAKENYSKTNVAARSRKHKEKLQRTDPIKYTCSQMASSSKKRATALGMPHDLDTNFLISIAPEICPVLHKEIKYGGGEKTKYSASLDKINPNLGYTKSNVRIISNLANVMKNEANREELQAFSKWIIESQTCPIDVQILSVTGVI